MSSTRKFKRISCAEFEQHIAEKTLVKPRPDCYVDEEALVWELSDGSIVGYTVTTASDCPTCGPDYTSVYYLSEHL